MSMFFDEASADQAVIESLIREINQLRSNLMPIVKTTDNKFYAVEDSQELTREQVQEQLQTLRVKENELADLLGESVPAQEPVAPVAEPVVAEAPAPVELVQPQPVEQPVPQPEVVQPVPVLQ